VAYASVMTSGATPSSPTVRGVVMLGLLDWVRAEHGEPGLARVLAQLPEELRSRYEGPRPKVVATTPIPAPELADLAAAIISNWELPAYHAAAAHVAMSDLNGYMRLFLKVGTPSFVLRRLPRVLTHYCSVGELSIVDSHASAATLSLVDVEAYGRAITEGAVGWIRAALELSGAKELHIDSRIDAGRAQYTLRWR
jgi:uncharacterized protein (TIGR02265 family)